MAITRVKICGIARVDDAVYAADYGADAIGLNFVAGPRKVGKAAAEEILRGFCGIDPVIQRRMDIVSLCGISKREFPEALTWEEAARSDFYQIYGENHEKFLDYPNQIKNWWMVVPIGSREAITDAVVKVAMLKSAPAAVLFDTGAAGKLGGTGQVFNWNWIAEAREAGELNGFPPIILAGGLTPENVAEAIRVARPYAVDVSSGVEVVGKPGVKDPIKMRDFIQAAKSAI